MWVLKMEAFRLPKIVLHGESNTGFRGRGRPKRNYQSYIKVDLKQFNLWDTYQQSASQERVPDMKKMAKFNCEGISVSSIPVRKALNTIE